MEDVTGIAREPYRADISALCDATGRTPITPNRKLY